MFTLQNKAFRPTAPSTPIKIPPKAVSVYVDEKGAPVPPIGSPPSDSDEKSLTSNIKLIQLMKKTASESLSKSSRPSSVKNIKVWIIESVPLAVTSDGSGLYGGTYYLNDLRNLADFSTYSALFDQYRVLKYVTVYDPLWSGSTGGTAQPGLVAAFDYDNIGSSAVTTAGTATVLNYKGGQSPLWHKMSTEKFELSLDFKRTIKKADAVSTGGTFLESFPGTWTNCQSGAGNTGSIRMASTGATANTRAVGLVFRQWYVEFAFKFL